nr:ATP-binding protein [Bacilli bacterium]
MSEKWEFGKIKTIPDWMQRLKDRPSKSNTADTNVSWVRIIPFAGQKHDADKLPSKLGGLGGEVHWRFCKDGAGKISVYAGYQSADALRRALEQRLTDADLQATNEPPTYEEKFVNRVGELGGVLNDKAKLESILDALENDTYLDIVFEQRPDHEFKNALKNRGGTAKSDKSHMSDAADAWKELLFMDGKTKPKTAAKGQAPAESNPVDKDRAKQINDLLAESTNYFRVSIKLGAAHSKHIQTIFTELNSQFKHRHRLSLSDEAKSTLWKKGSAEGLWREAELAVLVALPDMTHTQMARSVTHMKPGEQTLNDDQLTDGIAVGRLIHPVKSPRLVKIPTKQFLRHFFMGGKNGSGKSSTAVQMIQSLLDEWGENPDLAPGFTYIDPAGSTLTIVLNRLLKLEQQGVRIPWEKVHYIDMTPTSQYPVGLNLLYHEQGEGVSAVASGALDVIKSAFGGDAIFTERLMENGMMTLLYDTHPHTILGLTSILQYPAMREHIDILDPLVQEFWETTGNDLKPKDLDPLLNRLRPLLMNPAMRRIFGQQDWTLDILKWMDEGHIVLVNVLNLEPKNMGLVGGQFLMRYHATAKTREPDISKPHILMIDEAHNVRVPILEKVIAEDRKFGLSLGLITQFPEQFDGLLLKSISENMGTFLTCTVGPSSASVMSKMMNGAFAGGILQGLPTSRVAVYTSIDGEPLSFTVKSDPPVIYRPTGELARYEDAAAMRDAQGWAKAKAEALSSRDGKSSEAVDQEIAAYFEWLKQFKDVDEDEDKPNGKPSKEVKVYKPTADEQVVLEGLCALVGDRGGWEGRTSELLTALEDVLDAAVLEDWTAKVLGVLLSKAVTYLAVHGIQANSVRKEKGTFWSFQSS